MARLVTETFDPKDLLLFSQPAAAFPGSFPTPSPLIDFEAALIVQSQPHPILVLSTFPGETYGGFFYRFDGTVGGFLGTSDVFLFSADTSLLGKIRVNGGNDKLELLDHLGAVLATGTVNIQLGRNYHIQWHYKVNNVTGIFEIKLDEDLDVLTFNGDTTGAGGAYTNRFELNAAPSGNFFESLYINDTDGAENNGYDGVVRMKSFVPTADDLADWLLSSGSDGFAMLNQTPQDGDTTYIYSNVNGDKSSFVCPGHGLLAPSEIMAVSARWVVRKVSDGRIRPFFRINSTDYPIVAASVPIGVGYGVVMDRRTVNPDTTLPWALGDLIDSFGLESIL